MSIEDFVGFTVEPTYFGDHPFSSYAKYSRKLVFSSPWYAQCEYHGVRIIRFSQNLVYLLNSWFLWESGKIYILAFTTLWYTAALFYSAMSLYVEEALMKLNKVYPWAYSLK